MKKTLKIIIGLIFLPITLIYWIWAKSSWKTKNKAIGTIGVFAFFSVVGAINGNSSKDVEPASNEVPETTTAITTTVAETTTAEVTTVQETTIVTTTTAPEITTTEKVTTVPEITTTIAVNDSLEPEDVAALLEVTLRQSIDDVSVQYESGTDMYVCSINYPGLAEAAGGVISGQVDKSNWDNMVNVLAKTCKTMQTTVQDLDEGAHVSFFVLNNLNTKQVIVTIVDGEVVADVVNDELY